MIAPLTIRAIVATARYVARGVTAPIGNWCRRRATLRALMALDDQRLKDIGLSRSEIPRQAREAASRGGPPSRE